MQKLGNLEFRVAFNGDGETVETVTTPGMWALADEWVDRLLAKGNHTPAWCQTKMAGAIFLLAAQAEGLVKKGPITYEAIAEVLNRFDPDILETPEEGENPTTDDPGEDPA